MYLLSDYLKGLTFYNTYDYEESSGLNLELKGKLSILKENLVKTQGAVTAQNIFTRL